MISTEQERASFEEIVALSREFIKSVPPDSLVWDGRVCGITIGGERVYVSNTDGFVLVKCVNGNPDAYGLWSIRVVTQEQPVF